VSGRSSAAWLIGVPLILITALGVGGAFLRFRKCMSCGALVRETEPPRPLIILNCPDCGDRGKVSVFRAWTGPRVSDPVAGFLRSLAAEEGPAAFECLNQMIRNDGKDPETFLAGSSRVLDARFLDAEGKTYLVLIMGAFTKNPSGAARTALLIRSDGRASDRALVTFSGPSAQPNEVIHGPTPPDGTRVAIYWHVARRWPETADSYQVDLWERPGHETQLKGKPEDPIVRLAIRGDRFEVLTPEVRR
jgi:hypothetical protein